MTRPRRMLVCALPSCRREFRHPEGKLRKYCSPEHARLGRAPAAALPEQVCEADGCTVKFTRRRPGEQRRFCSRACASSVVLRDGREVRARQVSDRPRERVRTPRATTAAPAVKRPPAEDAEVVRLLVEGGLSRAQVAHRCGITTARVGAVAERRLGDRSTRARDRSRCPSGTVLGHASRDTALSHQSVPARH